MKLQERETKKVRQGFLFAGITTLVFLLAIVPLTAAQEASETTGKFRMEASFFFGVGLDKIEIGTTTAGDVVSISGGGGVGGAITLGYSFSKELEADLGAGFQHGTLSKKVENAKGSFERILVLATLKYKIPVRRNGQVKIGGGAGYYGSGELDLDASQVAGGAHNIYKYDDAFGFHVTGEYEGFFSARKWSWIIGVKYYNVRYDVKSCTSSGVSVPANQIPEDGREVDGSGVDFILAIARYF